MIKTRNIRKLLLTCALACVMLVGTGTACFADINVQNNDSATVPVYMTKGAQTFDFSITERVDMTSDANSTVLECSDVVLTNNVATGHIKYSLALTSYGDWTAIKYNDSPFKDYSVGTKCYGLLADGTHDMKTPYEEIADVGPGGSHTTTFEGGVATQITAVNTQVGNIIATVHWL